MTTPTAADWCLLARCGLTPENHMTATSVDLWDMPGVTGLYTDNRSYVLLRINGLYMAGCRSFTADEALAHWGADDYDDPERGAAFCAAIRAAEEAQT